MITAKFGGTAVTPRNLIHLKEIVAPFHNCVVVSAIGKEYQQDVKTTDLLVNYYDTHSDVIWSRIADKYRRLVEVNGIDIDVETLLSDAKTRATQYDLQYCMSLGEELAAKMVARFLNAIYIEAEQVVRFDENGELDRVTYANVRHVLNGVKLAVVGGFYGGNSRGRQTFSRGGSDVTGAIFASALDSTLYENWTDVAGVCVANPVKVHGVATVDGMSYGEMLLLSRAGAEVLHPDAVTPVEAKGIPIRICNFYNPNGGSTLISACPSHNKLLSIAERDVDGKFVTTVLHSYSDWQIARLISRFLKKNTYQLRYFDSAREVSSLALYNVEFSPNVVRIVTDVSILSGLYKSLIK